MPSICSHLSLIQFIFYKLYIFSVCFNYFCFVFLFSTFIVLIFFSVLTFLSISCFFPPLFYSFVLLLRLRLGALQLLFLVLHPSHFLSYFDCSFYTFTKTNAGLFGRGGFLSWDTIYFPFYPIFLKSPFECFLIEVGIYLSFLFF